jgi:plastocyanin
MSLVYQRCLLLAAAMLCAIGGAFAQGSTIKAHLVMNNHKHASKATAQEPNAVVWLTPANGRSDSLPRAQNAGPRPELVQKNKQFTPHVTAVEVGSVVDFPNHDPFFHNVFSLFNGKRFDLGLYEAGSTRSVHFDRAGICYIFCNIHPQMSAIVVVVNTPYFAVSNKLGDVVINNVPPGDYTMDLWDEHCSPEDLKAASREVTVRAETFSLGTIRLDRSRELVMVHSNKYGRNYDPQVFSSPIYSQP